MTGEADAEEIAEMVDCEDGVEVDADVEFGNGECGTTLWL